MSAIKNGGPAFPQAKVTVLAGDGTPNEAASVVHGGMTLRDYFAAKAMHAALVTAQCIDIEQTIALSADLAYQVADAMLAARSAVVQPEPNADDWVEWNGGECPVPAGTLVDYQMCDGAEERNVPASDLRWSHMARSSDILAYRVVGEVKQ